MVELPEDPSELSREFIRTGTEVEAIETVGESFDHIVTAKVLSKEAHPDSDHLWVTMVDVGTNNVDAEGNPEPLQIVCGAQNFNEGDHIVTAMIGAELPGDIKIKKGKLRGVVSCGMNCSARELGLRGVLFKRGGIQIGHLHRSGLRHSDLLISIASNASIIPANAPKSCLDEE